MNRIRRATGSAVVFAWLGLLGACGMAPKAQAPAGEPAPAAAPPPPPPAQEKAEDGAEPATLAEAEALLEKARANLDRLALNPAPATPGAAGAPAPAPGPASAPRLGPPRDDARRADKAPSMSSADEAAAPPAKQANTCETTCKAFSSLTRASEAVCRLDTDGGKRCERARQIQVDASQRVANCGCTK